MKLLLIPLYLVISSQVPWQKFSIHNGLLSNIFFDIIFIILSIKFLKTKFKFQSSLEKGDLGLLVTTIFLALGSILGLKSLSLSNPFQFVSLLFLNLVVIGPIVEEFIFRIVFNSLYSKNKNLRHILSGLIFSFSHSLSMIHSPSEWYKFFYLQIFYTFFLGIICSISFERSRNALKPILLHILFNLSFYVVTELNLI
jgi:membrane protease YdiL (CAAX protease family)